MIDSMDVNDPLRATEDDPLAADSGPSPMPVVPLCRELSTASLPRTPKLPTLRRPLGRRLLGCFPSGRSLLRSLALGGRLPPVSDAEVPACRRWRTGAPGDDEGFSVLFVGIRAQHEPYPMH